MNEFQPISDKELKRGYWWITHRQQLRQGFFLFFIFLVGVLYFFLVVNIFRFSTQSGWQKTAASLKDNFDWQAQHLASRPQMLQISGAQYFSVGGGRYNLVAFIQNPNTDWLVPSFEYNFIVNGETLPAEIGFLNSSENKMLLKIGYENTAGIKSLEVKLSDNINWQRQGADISPLNWEITNIEFTPATTQDINGETIKIDPRLTWQAKNLSLYNFWNVNFQVALYNRDQLIAVNVIKAKDFNSLESRKMEVIWLNTIGRVTTYKVIPEINWLDKDNFKNIEVPVREGERFDL